MIDPLLWADTPGMGRAPLLPDPQGPAGATRNPMRDIALRLMGQEDRQVRPEDRPVGMMVRPPSQMTIDEMVMESRALGGPQRFAPNVAATVASMGAPGLGTLAGLAGRRGIDMRQRQLSPEIEHRLGGILATGAPTPVSMRPSGGDSARITRTPVTQQRAFHDAYEAGRQAARGYRPERESRGGGDSLSGGRGGTERGGGSGSDTLSGGRWS